MGPGLVPTDIDLDRRRHLKITWDDGLDSVIPLRQVRLACPCATCRAGREARAKNPLAVIQPQGSVEDQVTAASAALVGHYALRIIWNDGHDAGIYDFATLRGLSEAAARESGGSSPTA